MIGCCDVDVDVWKWMNARACSRCSINNKHFALEMLNRISEQLSRRARAHIYIRRNRSCSGKKTATNHRMTELPCHFRSFHAPHYCIWSHCLRRQLQLAFCMCGVSFGANHNQIRRFWLVLLLNDWIVSFTVCAAAADVGVAAAVTPSVRFSNIAMNK